MTISNSYTICGISGLILAVTVVTPVSAAVKGRFYGDFNLGGGYDDSILRDASKINDRYFPMHLNLGWKGRLSKLTQAKVNYKFSHREFAKRTSEIYRQQYIKSSIGRRVDNRMYLKFNFETESHNQPNISAFNYRWFLYEPWIEYKAADGTLVGGALAFESETYPNYNLDYKGSGYKFKLAQDVGIYGDLSLNYSQRGKNYSERTLFLDSSGTRSAKKRNDKETSFDIELARDWRKVSTFVGYSLFDIDSNGNYVDFSLNQSGDERLISNYYSYVSNGPFAGISFTATKNSLIALSGRWNKNDYKGRIVKNSQDQFVAGDPKRQDKRQIFSIQATRFFPFNHITYGLTLGWSGETSKSTDSLYTFSRNGFFMSFRGWF